MKINNYTNSHISFNGNLKIVGRYTNRIKSTFLNNKTYQNLVKDKDFDIVAYIKSREATRDELIKEGKDDILYKLTIKQQKHAKSLFEKFIRFFEGNKTINKTRNYHSENTIVTILNGNKKFNIL